MSGAPARSIHCRVGLVAILALVLLGCAAASNSDEASTAPSASASCVDRNADTEGLEIRRGLTIELAGPDALMTDTRVIANSRIDAAALVNLHYEVVGGGQEIRTASNRPCGQVMLLPGADFREEFWAADDGRRIDVVVDDVTWIPSEFGVAYTTISYQGSDQSCIYDDLNRMTSCELINVDPFDVSIHPNIYVVTGGDDPYFVAVIRWGAAATTIPARSTGRVEISTDAVERAYEMSAGRGYGYGPSWDIALEQPDFAVPADS